MFRRTIFKGAAVILAAATLCLCGVSGCRARPRKGDEKGDVLHRPANHLELRMQTYTD